MIPTSNQKHIELNPASNCRREVEIAMMEMLNNLLKRGWSPAELALALADASEDHVMLVASKKLRSH